MSPRQRMRAACALGLALVLSHAAHATPTTDVVDIDLAALIAEAARTPERFAVDVAHAISSDKDGEWTTEGSSATWRYGVRIPTAVSLSFHATRFALPAGATLTVHAGDSSYLYRASDLHGATFWSRISKGDTLDFELAVAVTDRARVALDLASFQVGFRGLNESVQDNPQYTRWRIQTLGGTANASCVQNYACNITPNNAGPGRAAVAVFVRNIGACSGTLLNNVTGDNTPYVLTARHCQNPTVGGAPPAAPEDISVYWNALTPCGQPLNSVYYSNATVQSGLTTVVEQEDIWLLLLDQSPVISDAYFAGFDATGASVVGGYTMHHAIERTKQLTNWFGQAFSESNVFPSLGGRYTSHFWETVQSQGTIGPGASGSALFDQNDHVVGALSLGGGLADESGWVQCPSVTPTAPNGHNSIGYFTQLAAAWNSTADTSSATGARTLKSVLDPEDSGMMVVDGAAALSGVTFAGSAHSLLITDTLSLDWNAPGATSCMASGGVAGDGWTGTLAAQGEKGLRESADGVVTYMIACAFSGGRVAKARVVVTWLPPTPYVNLISDRRDAWTTRPVKLTWGSNQSSCSITGGSTSLANLGPSGSTTVTEAIPANVTYTLSCGSGTRVAQTTVGPLSFTAPSVQFTAGAADRRPSTTNLLRWRTGAETCTSSGGGPDDGWEGQQRSPDSSFLAFARTPGTYTYTLTCMSGALSAQASVAFTVRDVPAYATLTTSTATIGVGQDFTVSWKSNVSSCQAVEDTSLSLIPTTGSFDEGSAVIKLNTPGTHTFVLRCVSSGIESAPVIVTAVAMPTVEMKVDNANLLQGQAFNITWVTGSVASCTASGGGADSTAWSGDVGTTGSTRRFNATNVGSFTYSVACVGVVTGSTAQGAVTVTVSAPVSQGAPFGGGGSGGGGGGGALNWISLLGLALFAASRVLRAGARAYSTMSL
jgi:lysyl endopeptidase